MERPGLPSWNAAFVAVHALYKAAHPHIRDNMTLNKQLGNAAGGRGFKAVETWLKTVTPTDEAVWQQLWDELARVLGPDSVELWQLSAAWHSHYGRPVPPWPPTPPNRADHTQPASPGARSVVLVGTDATVPIAWTVIDGEPRKYGFADINAHPPQRETPDGRSALNVTVSLDTYEDSVPDAEGQPGFPIRLSLTGIIEVIARLKNAERVPFTERGDAALPVPNGMTFGGGLWKIDLGSTGRSANWPLRNEPLCDIRRTAPQATVTVELRCLPRVIDPVGIPAGLPTTKEAVIRRLFQFPTVNTENDRIALAYSVIGVPEA